MAPLLDSMGRPIRDLRISVTDRCNFRCAFCMPSNREYEFLPRKELLSFEEIVRLCRIFLDLGVKKFRITGGEPLLRKNIEKLIQMISPLEGLEDLALTTNGILLAQKAPILKEAGLKRVTVSLHSMNRETFQKITGSKNHPDSILASIDKASEAGLKPIKVNVVAMKGTNEDTLVDLARYFKERGHILRFIEYMDVGTLNSWDSQKVLSAREIIQIISEAFPLEPLEKAYSGEVALRYRYRDGLGEVGVIASITQPFCGDCNRIRLSSDGKVYTCLFATAGLDLKQFLREGASDEEIKEILQNLWNQRRDRYSEERKETLQKDIPPSPQKKVEMFRMGG